MQVTKRGRPSKQTTDYTSSSYRQQTTAASVVNSNASSNATINSNPVNVAEHRPTHNNNNNSSAHSTFNEKMEFTTLTVYNDGTTVDIDRDNDCGVIAVVGNHGLDRTALGNILTLENAADGTLYIVHPLVGKVAAELEAGSCLVDSSGGRGGISEGFRTIPVATRERRSRPT